MSIALSICTLLLFSKSTQPGECLQQAFFCRAERKCLANHVIETKHAKTKSKFGLYIAFDIDRVRKSITKPLESKKVATNLTKRQQIQTKKLTQNSPILSLL